MEAAGILQVLLVIDIAAGFGLAVVYLCRRRLGRLQYLAWALLALFPVLGPFLVIASRPGAPRRRYAAARRVFAGEVRLAQKSPAEVEPRT